MTDDHDNGLNLSLSDNPYHYEIGNHEAYSIFMRTDFPSSFGFTDGNLFIYALKNALTWKISDKDWKFEFNERLGEPKIWFIRFIKILNKMKNEFDTLIIVPSSSELNFKFGNLITKHLKFKDVIKDVFVKIPLREVTINKKALRENFGENSNEIILNITRSLVEFEQKETDKKHMNPRDIIFQAKAIPKHYLNYLNPIVTINKNSRYDKLSRAINGKRILIIDDTISTGKTLLDCVNAIETSFVPKVIKILTLVSPLSK